MSMLAMSRPKSVIAKQLKQITKASQLEPLEGSQISVYYPIYHCIDTYTIVHGIEIRRYHGTLRPTLILKDRFRTKKLVRVIDLVEDTMHHAGAAADLAERSQREIDGMPIVVPASQLELLEAYVHFLES